MRRKHQSIMQIWKKGFSIVIAGAMAVSMLPAIPASASAAAMERPTLRKAGSIAASDDSWTEEEPFASGTAGSQQFRIPALITLENGELLAAADARWETSQDGGGLDTVASVSSDGGKTWNYSFPLYFPDSMGFADSNATTIIDPGILEGPDGTIYCFADVNPTGCTTWFQRPVPTGNGFVMVDGKSRLAVTDEYSKSNTLPTDSDTTTYPYYVGDFNDEGFAPILNRTDSSATQYAVDEYYNIYSVVNGEYVDNLTQKQVDNNNVDVQQNLYYRDSLLHVYRIGYIWMITSKDHGRTWEHPRNINDQIKRVPNEHAILVSPGQGIATRSGDLILGFYDNAMNTGEEENASLIYSSDNGNTWKRTNDVPGSAAGGMWSSENEIVELENGNLRMFFRNGSNKITYSDAVKDENGDYTMQMPVSTNVSAYTSCNVSAISYSQKINGKQAILVACPGGSGRANGKIYTFLVNDDENSTMELFHIFSIPGTSAFAYSCLTELDDGSLGLLWEPNNASIFYDHFSIFDVIPNAKIDNINLNLKKGESYTRTYTLDGTHEITQDKLDSSIASVTAAENLIAGTVGLCDHKSSATASSISGSYESSENSSISLEMAEMTITKQGDTADVYHIYNEATQTYLNDQNAINVFGDAADMVLKPTETSAGTGFLLANGSSYSTTSRHMCFYYPQMNFNANGAYQQNYTDGAQEFVLLEKQDAAGEGDILPGYKRVSAITSGKKYLITYIWSDGSVLVLYPTNGQNAMSKLAVKNPASTEVTLTIQAIGAGDTEVTVDGTRYAIHVYDNVKPVELEVGETYNIPGEAEYEGPQDEKVIKVSHEQEQKYGLLKHIANVDSSMESFSSTLDKSASLEVAEFTFNQSGEKWQIYNEAKTLYLTNATVADSFFTTEAADMTVTATEGSNTFRISNANGSAPRFAIFFYTQMNFNANTNYNASFTAGSYELTLLEKQEQESDDDVIPGYKLATTITSGKKYLITYLWNDHVMVLYPVNGLAAQTKCYGMESENYIQITGMGAGTADVVYDGWIYRVTVNGQEADETEKAKAALAEAVTAAKEAYEAGQGNYTDETWNAFKQAYEAAAAPAADADAAALTALANALTAAKGALAQKPAEVVEKEEAQERLNMAVESAKKDFEAGKGSYTEESWKKFEAAYQAAKNPPANADAATLKKLASELEAAKKALKADSKPGDTQALQAALTEAKKLDLNGYTAASADAFKKALAEAEKVLADKLATQAQVDAVLKALNAAKAGLKEAEIVTKVPAAGTVFKVGALQYKVTKSDAKKGTVAVVKALAKKAKVVIPATVKKDGYTFKVTAVNGKVFQKNKKLKTVIIGKNVKKIGAKAFFGCKKLKTVTFKSKKALKIGSKAFKGIKANCRINVPKKMKNKQLKTLKKRMKSAGKKVTYRKK